MKIAVIYSSLTGNTKQVAEAIHSIMPEGADLFDVKTAPAPDTFDCLFLGFWADRGEPDKAMRDYMETLQGKGKKIGLFGTLGAYPESEHCKNFMQNAENMLAGNTILGKFACMGKVAGSVLKTMDKMRQRGNDIHPMTPERQARLEEGNKHPNEGDFKAAQEEFGKMLELARA